MFIPTQIRPSQFGQGIFTTAPVPKGTVICFFSLGGKVITEQQFLEEVQKGNPSVIRTGTRYVGRYFVYGQDDADHNYVNHSFTPNCLCHCGIVLARRAIDTGEELTVDYRTLIDPTDIGTWRDATTNETIKGYPAKETLLRTARELIEIVETIPDWEG